MATVLLVEEEIETRSTLRSALELQGYTVLSTTTGTEALEMAANEQLELILLGLRQTTEGVSDICRELRSWCNSPIIVLSASNRPQDKVQAFDAGADDYVTKPFDLSELRARIRSLLRRRSLANASAGQPVLRCGELRLDVAHHQVFVGEAEVRLSKTEFALLKSLMSNAGRILSYETLLSQIWGHENGTEAQVLRVHISNLRRKIESDPQNPQYVLTALGLGYRFRLS